jgi:molecular chaperone DnaK
VYELNREVREYYSEDDEYDLFGSIRSVFTGEGDRESGRDTFRDYEPYGRERNSAPREPRPYYGGAQPSRKRPTYQDNWDEEDDDWL